MVEYPYSISTEDILLGEKQRSEPMFYYIKLDDLIPEDHLLRLIHRYVDFSFIRDRVKRLYSHTGRPSIDPEVLLRMLLVGYLYGIRSERRLCEEVSMHIGYRWFVGLSLQDKVPDHSTFSKNRHERFAENDLFQHIFDAIINQCMTHGFIDGKHLTIDATHIQADTSFKSMETIVVEFKPKEYIEVLEKENPVEDPYEPGEDYPLKGQKISNNTHRSQTDPDARLSRKSSTSTTQLCHAATYVMDNKSRVIVGADIANPDRHTDCETALSELQRIKWRYKITPETIGADKGYATGEFIQNLINENIVPHIPVISYRDRRNPDIYPIAQFTYNNTDNIFLCPQGKELKYRGIHKHGKQHVYRARTKDCSICPVKSDCTKDRARSVSYHIYEYALKTARELSRTKGYYLSQRMRKKIEELFGEAKEFMGFRRSKFRGRKWIKEQVLMTATAQNIKRMVKMFSRGKLKEKTFMNDSVWGSWKRQYNPFMSFLHDRYEFVLLCEQGNL
jgi:transposase